MRLRSLAVVVLLALLGAPACSRGGGGDDGFRLQLDGTATITSTSTEGDRTVEAGKHSLAAGDTVRMLDGDAVLGLPGDRSLWLRAGAGDGAASIVKVADKPDIVDGDAVVMAGSDGMHFTAGDVDVRLAEGAARVQRGLGVTVVVYRGSVEVRSAGRALAGGLPALRQVSVAATGLLPRQPVPLLYDAVQLDAWDQRFLGDAIDLGKFLDKEAKGFTTQIGPRASVDAALLQRVLPPLADERSVPSLLAGTVRSAGEALVGAAIVVESGRGSFDERWDDVFSFREAGARWGLVALDQQVKRDALTGRLRDAVGRSPLLFAAGPSLPTGGSPSGAATPTTAQPPSAGGGPTTAAATAQPPSGGGGPTTTIPPITIPPLLIGSGTPPEQSPSDPGDADDTDDGDNGDGGRQGGERDDHRDGVHGGRGSGGEDNSDGHLHDDGDRDDRDGGRDDRDGGRDDRDGSRDDRNPRSRSRR